MEADIVVLGLEIEAESANSSDEMPLHPSLIPSLTSASPQPVHKTGEILP